jgi:hypothetical protein
VANASKQQKTRQGLLKSLVRLRADSAAVETQIARTNQLEYRTIARIYLWWRAASTVPGFLEKVYAPTMVRRVFGEREGELSFRRLLYVVYGVYGLDKDPLDRKNRALLRLHEAYEKNPSQYVKDGVEKLVGVISNAGGLISFISSKSAAKASGTAPHHAQAHPGRWPKPRVDITDSMRYGALGTEAVEFFNHQAPTQYAQIQPPVATNLDGIALAILKRDQNQYQVISASDTVQGTKEILVNAYRKRIDATPLPLRCLLELVKTQSLPPNLLRLYDKLVEKSDQKHEDRTHKRISRRVTYLAEANRLLLSATYSQSGVVTVANLKQGIFEGAVRDCFMPTRCRKLLEYRLLAPSDSLLYRPSDNTVIPALNRSGLASHLMRLDNKAVEADFFFVEFWPFEDAMGPACFQLTYSEPYLKKCKTAITVPKEEFAKFAYDHVNKWLSSYGDHITRPANEVLCWGIDSQGFKFAFDSHKQHFRNNVRCDFDAPLSSVNPQSATFLAKDLCIALHSIGELRITGDILVRWASEAVFLSYETDVAAYTIAIPTTRDRSRNDHAFTQFAPSIASSSEVSEPSDPDEETFFEAALAESNSSLTDEEIERIIGFSQDDYEELTEGLYEREDDEDRDGAGDFLTE